MKSILLIILLFLVCISGCVAQEKGIFIVDAMTFDTTSARRSRVLIEVSPTKQHSRLPIRYGSGKNVLLRACN